MHKIINKSLAGKKVHFVGVGGVSMSALAAMFLESGGKVTGSDIKNSQRISQLRDMGGKISINHSEKNIEDQDLLVYSSAIPEDNIELKSAQKHDIPVVTRAEFLASLIKNKRVVAISGTHGKTSTTAMITEIFMQAQMNPSVMLGGEMRAITGNYRQGEGELFIIEADESDGSLVNYDPWLGVVTNLEAEHLNYYQTELQLIETMKEFLTKVKDDGYIVLCADDPMIKAYLLPFARTELDCDVISYGINSGDYTADKIKNNGYVESYNVNVENEDKYKISINSPGRHNVLNSLAALSSARAAGIDWTCIQKSLRDYKGVKRRFEKKGSCKNIEVVDDYAHHPTEIYATYQTAVKTGFNRVLTVFQPHRYTRTEALWDEFLDKLYQIKHLLICDIYPANQEPIPGITSRRLAEELKYMRENQVGWIKYAGEPERAKELLLSEVREGDLVLTMGAGNVNKIGEDLLADLRSKNSG